MQLLPTGTVTATPRLPQQGPGFTRQTRPCDPKGQQCRLVRRPQSTGLSPGPSLRRLEFALLCTALGPGLRGRQGTALWKFTIGAQGPHVFREGGWEPQPVCPLLWKHRGPGWAFPDLTLQREGHPRPIQLYVAASPGCGV